MKQGEQEEEDMYICVRHQALLHRSNLARVEKERKKLPWQFLWQRLRAERRTVQIRQRQSWVETNTCNISWNDENEFHRAIVKTRFCRLNKFNKSVRKKTRMSNEQEEKAKKENELIPINMTYPITMCSVREVFVKEWEPIHASTVER